MFISTTTEDNIFNNSNISHTAVDDMHDDMANPYFGDNFSEFYTAYRSVHGYISFFVCIFGITANILNIIVLTSQNIITSTTAILTGLAVSDTLVMIPYLPYSFHFYIRTDLEDKDVFTYKWAVFSLICAHFAKVNHMISSYLTVTIAVWRFIAVRFPTKSKEYCTMKRARWAIFSTYVLSVVLCLPIFFTFTVIEFRGEYNEIMYTPDFTKYAEKHGDLLLKINFWYFGVITKFIPCISLAGFIFGLLKVLYKAKKIRQALKNFKEVDKTHDRITQMLLVVLTLFLVTELPSGILLLLSGILGNEFFKNVYLNLSEVLDILALINNSINFIIYCSMSQKFRSTFAQLFLPNCFRGTSSAISKTPSSK